MLKFRGYVPEERREYLQKEYDEFVKKNKLKNDEKKELRQWVITGHSVYDNPDGFVNGYLEETDFVTNMRLERDRNEYEEEYVWSPYADDLVCIRKKKEKKKKEKVTESEDYEEEIPF